MMDASVKVGGQGSWGLVKDDVDRNILRGIRQVLNPFIFRGHQSMNTRLWHRQGLTPSSTIHELAASSPFDFAQIKQH